MQKEIANELSQLMLEVAAKLDASIRLVQENCSTEEFQLYRKSVGQIMGIMLTEVMNPIYREHPDLKPRELH